MTKFTKTLGFTLATLSQHSLAQTGAETHSIQQGNSIIDSVVQGGAALLGNIRNPEGDGRGPAAQRQFGVSSPFDGFLVNYGCWCFFEDGSFNRRAGQGKGGPVDAFDATCRRLQLAYRCAIMDAQANDEVCHPWGTNYAMVNTALVHKSTEDITTICTKESKSECEKNACIIEGNFMNELYELIETDKLTMTESFKHAGGFDVTTECVKTGQTGENDCCGTYPTRYPYRVDHRECCADGTSAPMGRC